MFNRATIAAVHKECERFTFDHVMIVSFTLVWLQEIDNVLVLLALISAGYCYFDFYFLHFLSLCCVFFCIARFYDPALKEMFLGNFGTNLKQKAH